MTITMPEIFKIKVEGASQSKARTDLKVGNHTIIIDEPVQRGGTDIAPSPLETMISSFLGCTNVIANIIASDLGITIDKMVFDLVAHLDTRGVFNKAAVTVPFPKIELTVDITTSASDAEVEVLKTELARRCPVSVILRESGSEIVETWRIVRP